MAAESHWVNEVFPVKFSINDLLGDGEADLASLEPNLKIKHSYRDACNRLIVNEERSSLAKEAVGLHLNRGEIQKENSLVKKEGLNVCTSDKNEKQIIGLGTADAKLTSKENGCLWTKEELDIFRDGYFNLKKRAVHLLFLLSESRTQIKELKGKCRESKIKISNQEHLLSEQKKQNLKLNATIKELRTDHEFSDKKIQSMMKLEAQLKDQNKFLQAELEDERRELSQARELCMKLDKSLKRQKKEIRFGYIQYENVLKTRHVHITDKLEKENERLRAELEKEKNDHKLTKVALEQLRKHFANMENTTVSHKFLDVAEIENFVGV